MLHSIQLWRSGAFPVNIHSLFLPKRMVYRSSMSIQPIWINWPVLITYCACLIPYLSSVSGKVFVNLQLIEYWDCFLTILIWNAIADYIVYMLIIKLVLSCEQSCDIYFSLHPPGVTLQLLTAVWCEIQGFTGKVEIKSREKQFSCVFIFPCPSPWKLMNTWPSLF